MEAAFPGFSQALSQVLNLESLDIQPFESRRLKSASPRAHNFMQNVYKCRGKEASFKKKCIVRAIAESDCNESLNSFTSCVQYVANDTTPPEYRNRFYCSKREMELKNCVNDLMGEILYEISGGSFCIITK